jgi:SAM-dependent methyltransferase
MNMYSLIASEYDHLFPHPQAKTDFVERYLSPGPVSVLDLGCATGELLLSLAKESRELTGIDLDGEMIRAAVEKAAKRGLSGAANFLQFDMSSYMAHGEGFSRDLIICFGNTTAYLDGPEELAAFLKNAYSLLRPQGYVILQILNYDNPSMNEEFCFTDLHTEKVCFTRSYSVGPRENLLFQTELTDLTTGEKSSDIHSHYPFHSKEISQASNQVGFRRCLCYGGYGFEEIKGTDFSRLFVLRK